MVTTLNVKLRMLKPLTQLSNTGSTLTHPLYGKEMHHSFKQHPQPHVKDVNDHVAFSYPNHINFPSGLRYLTDIVGLL